ncbi:hypothetical protein AQUCO_00600274v1 [Aquilegia coerulea]|uniref:Uncharacterized protein n=1 Tax=Aquilegia coerulea TaxID=218851 RepID=A0A2G5ENT3_AQUCA|nr:hypothetical protein AQUCO_00600274v1 [Aquilegia coerulea]
MVGVQKLDIDADPYVTNLYLSNPGRYVVLNPGHFERLEFLISMIFRSSQLNSIALFSNHHLSYETQLGRGHFPDGFISDVIIIIKL